MPAATFFTEREKRLIREGIISLDVDIRGPEDHILSRVDSERRKVNVEEAADELEGRARTLRTPLDWYRREDGV
jgi:hypothetical protein